jgi:hypothetical protein
MEAIGADAPPGGDQDAPWIQSQRRSGRVASEGGYLIEPLSCKAPDCALALAATGKHDGQQAGSLRWQPPSHQDGGVVGRDGSLDVSFARQSDGSPRLGQGQPIGRGHEHPHGKKRLLRNGPELEDVGLRGPPQVPRLGRMFIARPSGGLWHIWGSGFGGSYAIRRNSAALSEADRRTRVAPRPK